MGVLGKGRAQAITDTNISDLAFRWKVHPAALDAISKVESSGFGWFKDGRIKILFEKHWFYKNLSGAQRAEAVKKGLARKKWISPKRGGYKEQATASQRYNILAAAIKINKEAALQSISMGRYQIMGFNAALCGFDSAIHMWNAFLDSEAHQLRAFANFLVRKKLVKAIQRLDFETVEEVYNGGGLNGVYAAKMRKYYKDGLRGKWKHYNEETYTVVGSTIFKPAKIDPDTTKIPVIQPEREEDVWVPDKSDDVTGIAALIAVILGALSGLFPKRSAEAL